MTTQTAQEPCNNSGLGKVYHDDLIQRLKELGAPLRRPREAYINPNENA